jgi:hypothetical protein
VHVHTVDALAPCETKGFGKEPAPVALAGMLGHETDECELAFVRLTKIQFHHPDLAAGLVEHHVKLDPGVLDRRCEMRIIEDEPRKPEPGRSDEAK